MSRRQYSATTAAGAHYNQDATHTGDQYLKIKYMDPLPISRTLPYMGKNYWEQEVSFIRMFHCVFYVASDFALPLLLYTLHSGH